MIIISHRGNINGRSKQENNPSLIMETLSKFEVEIDVWLIKDELYLGHDKPQYLIKEDFLLQDKLWCHAKNIEALTYMIKNKIHCFWHQIDQYTITSKGFIWVYPNEIILDKGILVVEGKIDSIKETVEGICTDYPEVI